MLCNFYQFNHLLVHTTLIAKCIGIQPEQANFLATSLGFVPGTAGHKECKSVVEKLYKLFRTHDCTLVEVNPLAETPDGRVVGKSSINYVNSKIYIMNVVTIIIYCRFQSM